MYGSPGTGKTLMLIEVLRLKIGQLKTEKKPFKVIVGTYVDYPTELQKDLKGSFDISHLFKELELEVLTMEKLGKGA